MPRARSNGPLPLPRRPGISRIRSNWTETRKDVKGPMARTLSQACSKGNSSQSVDSASTVTFPRSTTWFPKSTTCSSAPLTCELATMPKASTMETGSSEASVTMPKPSSSPADPLDRATPMPMESTMGTVAGPVVIAPQSQDSPTMLRNAPWSGPSQQYAVSANVGTKLPKITGRTPKRQRSLCTPATAARPTPMATELSS
mmetsp:Transcript_30091/g.82665  ORF Transcript_30091/g.82665 Transcript_30091/m.82665 type:complete len:201 (+) Transcript_30091:839-1441(+)